MALTFDIHVHTSRYSRDSQLDPEKLIHQAVRMGLDGVVITEHQHVWQEQELAEIAAAQSSDPGFILLSGFEYTSSQGDILIYGITPEQGKEFVFGRKPEEAVKRAHGYGAVCIAAHPTRQGLGFDEHIVSLDLDGIEVASTNLRPHEQRLAENLAEAIGLPPTHGSDAHRLEDLGRYATEFLDPVTSMPELVAALRAGRFRPAGQPAQGAASR